MTDATQLMDGPAAPVRFEVNHIGKFYDFLEGPPGQAPIVVEWGGAGSGKSMSICQKLVERFYQETDLRILIIRKTGPSLTLTTWQMIQDVLKQYGHVENDDYEINRAERSIKHGDNIMWFQSLDKEEKKKSLNITDVYVEEPTEINWNEYLQLKDRLRYPTRTGRPNQMFLSFNPVDEYHWTKTEIIDKADYRERTDYQRHRELCEGDPKTAKISILHSTYKDNPFLPAGYREYLDHLWEQDKAHFTVYSLGEYAALENTIYTNYVIDHLLFSDNPTAMGIDFGYNNPTALVAVWQRDGELYLRELIFESYLTNQDLVQKLNVILPKHWRSVPMYADAAEPARIEEIARAGYNIRPGEKDVKNGIDVVKRYRVHLHADSQNLIREWRSYKWREDRNGRVLEEPVKLNDHACDAARYAIYSSDVIRNQGTCTTFKTPVIRPPVRQAPSKQRLPGFRTVTSIPRMNTT